MYSLLKLIPFSLAFFGKCDQFCCTIFFFMNTLCAHVFSEHFEGALQFADPGEASFDLLASPRAGILHP